jgi:hypothetical protein
MAMLKEEISENAPGCVTDEAASQSQAMASLVSWTYDLATFDIMRARALDLIEFADRKASVGRNPRTGMNTLAPTDASRGAAGT